MALKDFSLQENPSLELLGFKFVTDLKWRSYIWAIHKDTAAKIMLLHILDFFNALSSNLHFAAGRSVIRVASKNTSSKWDQTKNEVLLPQIGCSSPILTYKPWKRSEAISLPRSRWIMFNPRNSVSQTLYGKPIAPLSRCQWQAFKWATILSSTISDIYSSSTPRPRTQN